MPSSHQTPAVADAPDIAAVADAADIPLLRGQLPMPGGRTYAEFQMYEGGTAELRAAAFGHDPVHAWRRLCETYEPSSAPALDYVLSMPSLRRAVRGHVADIAAGSCWLAGTIAQLDSVERVYAQDLSEHFLRTVGLPSYLAAGGDRSKLTLVASDFNCLPLPDVSLDAVFIFAALHHSLAPILTLREIWRCLKPGGVVIIHEQPVGLLRVERARRWSESILDASEVPITVNDIRYFLRMAGLSLVHYGRVPLSRGWQRRLVRTLLYRTRLEPLIRPTPAVWVAQRPD